MKNDWIAKKRPQTKVSRKDQVDTKKERKRQQFLYGGVYWTPCDHPVIFRKCDLKREKYRQATNFRMLTSSLIFFFITYKLCEEKFFNLSLHEI